MAEEIADRRVGQRRIEERTECDIEARVELSDGLAIACRIKDLSVDGFKIQITDAIYIPDEFDLLVPVIDATFQRYRAKIVWRKADMVGGRFIAPIAQ